MLPFWTFYGGKYKLAPRLGPPRHEQVIECFAGSAGYSIYWQPKKVTLIDVDPIIAGLWTYLTKVSPREIMRIPSNIDAMEELPPWVCQEAKWLIGFHMNHGLETPAIRRSNWARQPFTACRFWSESIKVRIASQLDRVRHWKIIHGSYENAPDVRAHYFVDPPYSNHAGRTYRFHEIDYTKLAKFAKSRRGFVQVTAQDGANWMNFTPLTVIATHRRNGGFTAEALCELES
jgi:site-specific DNA-adenine methylase